MGERINMKNARGIIVYLRSHIVNLCNGRVDIQKTYEALRLIDMYLLEEKKQEKSEDENCPEKALQEFYILKKKEADQKLDAQLKKELDNLNRQFNG
jgi:hypothetical protein